MGGDAPGIQIARLPSDNSKGRQPLTSILLVKNILSSVYACWRLCKLFNNQFGNQLGSNLKKLNRQTVCISETVPAGDGYGPAERCPPNASIKAPMPPVTVWADGVFSR